MTKINLLPWREQERTLRKVRFGLTIAGAIGIGLLFIIIFHIYYKILLNNEQNRIQYLNSELEKENIVLTDLNRKQKELNKIDTDVRYIIHLRKLSYQTVRLLDTLPRIVPDGISFNKITKEGKNVSIVGKALTNLDITLLMKNISSNALFQNPTLEEISAKENVSGEERFFLLKFEQRDE